MASEVTQSGSNYDLAVAFSSLKINLTHLRDIKPIRAQRHFGNFDFKPQQVGQPMMPSLGTLSLGAAMKGEWVLENEFGEDGKGKLTGGRGISVAPNGNIVVANISSPRRVTVFSETGHVKYNIDKTQDLKAGVTSYPWNVAVSSDGRIFVTQQTSQVHVYDDRGICIQQFPTISLDNRSSDTQETMHMGITIDRQGHLLVAETNNRYISRHQLTGAHISSFKVSMQVYYIAANIHNKIIVSGNKSILIFGYEACVQILDQTGQLLCNIKSPTGAGWNPRGLCCTDDDEVYISSCNESIGIYGYSSETGKYLGCITKDVEYPTGLCLTEDGKQLFVAQEKSVKVFTLQ